MIRERAIQILKMNEQGKWRSGITAEEEKEAVDMAIKALKERPHGKWEYLKEHITEMRDADGKLNQKETCKFILNLMGVIEREGDEE